MNNLIDNRQYILSKTKYIVESILAEKNSTGATVGTGIPINAYDIDSMDLVAITEDIEATFDIRLSIDEINGESTVSEITDAIFSKIKHKNGRI